VSIVLKSGSLNLLEPLGPVMGLLYHLIILLLLYCSLNSAQLCQNFGISGEGGFEPPGTPLGSRDDLKAFQKKLKKLLPLQGFEPRNVQLVHEKRSLYGAQNVSAVARNMRHAQKC
jgi:hypothetical protein